MCCPLKQGGGWEVRDKISRAGVVVVVVVIGANLLPPEAGRWTMRRYLRAAVCTKGDDGRLLWKSCWGSSRHNL